MTPGAYIQQHQKLWGVRRGLNVDSKGYFATVDENLFEPLTPEATKQFNDADGNELMPQGADRPKMHALHSSSALVANVFQYWKNKDMSLLAKALGIPSPNIRKVVFEKLSPI